MFKQLCLTNTILFSNDYVIHHNQPMNEWFPINREVPNFALAKKYAYRICVIYTLFLKNKFYSYRKIDQF